LESKLKAKSKNSVGAILMRIHIVDDEMSCLNALRAFLVSAGHEVLVSSDPIEALQTIRTTRERSTEIDLLVTDLRMPGMDGLRLIRLARKEDPKLPVIMITAYGDRSTRREIEQIEGCGYMEKPIDPEKFMKTVSKVSR